MTETIEQTRKRFREMFPGAGGTLKLKAKIAKAKEAYLSVFDVRTLEMMDRVTATLPSAKLLKIWKALEG